MGNALRTYGVGAKQERNESASASPFIDRSLVEGEQRTIGKIFARLDRHHKWGKACTSMISLSHNFSSHERKHVNELIGILAKRGLILEHANKRELAISLNPREKPLIEHAIRLYEREDAGYQLASAQRKPEGANSKRAAVAAARRPDEVTVEALTMSETVHDVAALLELSLRDAYVTVGRAFRERWIPRSKGVALLNSVPARP